MMNGLNYDLFVDLLTSLKSISDLKWILRSLNADKYILNSQDLYLSKYQRNKLLEQNVKLALQEVIPTTGHELEYAINKGMKMLEDFHSNKKITTISLMGYILIKILKSKLQGLYINEQKLLMMKSNFHKTPVIFVPSHRSYLDFILMAFVCFNYNIKIPYVAAAMDFKNMKIVGNILRQCGAFFLHRGESAQNVINRIVLNEYIKYLITYENSPLQFFIEGTRSRSNKSNLPKLGILKYIVNVILQNEVQDITIIPISINYDRLLEDKLYSYELLGIPKPKETTFRLINSIKGMDNQYGNVYINFSTPISLKEYIGDMHTNGKSNESLIISTLAYEIINRQQQNMIVSYFNLIAVVLIYNLFNTTTDNIHLDIMIDQIKWISTLFEKCGAQIEAKDGDIKNRIIDTIKQHQHFVTLKNNMVQFQKDYTVNNNIQLPDKIQFKTETFNHTFPLILNQLYVNPLLHFGINIAFIIIVSKCRIIWKNDVLNLEGKFILLRKLFEYEFAFFDGFEKQDFKKSVSLYLHINENEKQLLRYLAVNPYILSYRLIYSTLINTCQGIISEENIYKSIYMNIEDSHIHPYGFTKDLIKAALDALNKIKIIQKYKKNDTIFYEINQIIIMELVKLFDNIVENENILLKTKI